MHLKKIAVKFSINNKKYNLTNHALLLVLFVGILIGLLLSECLARKYLKDFPARKEYLRFGCLSYAEIPKEMLDEYCFWRPDPEFCGLTYAFLKPENTFRVICVGGSTTRGRQMAVSKKEDSYVRRLEELLRKRFAGKNIEVINAGCAGYSSWQGLKYLERRLYRYEPDLVISWFGVNDSSSMLFYPDKEQRLPEESMLEQKGVLGHSKSYFFIKNMFLTKKPRVSIDDYYRNCERMIEIARRNNFEVIFVIPFAPKKKNQILDYLGGYKAAILGLKADHNFSVIDVAAELYRYKYYFRELFSDNSHPNKKGNRIIAQIMYEFIVEHYGKSRLAGK